MIHISKGFQSDIEKMSTIKDFYVFIICDLSWPICSTFTVLQGGRSPRSGIHWNPRFFQINSQRCVSALVKTKVEVQETLTLKTS